MWGRILTATQTASPERCEKAEVSLLKQPCGKPKRGLLEQGATVEQAAAGCGYHNLGHFYAMFQKVCGTTPGAYRREAIGRQDQRGHAEVACLKSVA